MAKIHVRVHRPVMGYTPGSLVEVEEDDDRVRKMIEFGHLRRVYDVELEPPPEDPGQGT